MKRRILTILSIVMALSIAAGSLAACSKDGKPGVGPANPTAQPQATNVESKKQLSANLKIMLPGDAPPAQEKVDKVVMEKCKADGLDFKFEYLFVPTNDFSKRAALIAASGEDMDILWTHSSGITDGVAKNMFAPLDDALKAEGQDLIKSIPEYVFKEVTIKGKIYAIPRVVPTAHNDWVTAVRGDIRKKYGVPEIKTLADFEKYADAIGKNEKQMTAICLSPREFLREYAPNYHFPANGGDYFYPVYLDMTDKELKVKNYLETDNFKKFCDKYYEWVQKGWATKDVNQLKLGSNDFIAGKIGTCYSNVMWPTEKIDKLKATSPSAEIETVMLNPEKPKYITTCTDNLLAIFAQSKKVNESVAFINWIRKNQENYDLYTFGLKDVTYKLEGDAVSYDGIAKENSYFPNSYAWTDLRFQRYSKYIDAGYINVIKNWDKGAVQSPLLGMVLNPDPYKEAQARLQTVHAQYTYPMQKGLLKYDDKKDEMLSKAKAAGIDTIISEVQKQVDAFKAAKK